MTKSRIIETDTGLQDEFIVKEYDNIMRESRDKGQLYTEEIIKFGINKGSALEIGPGPGYLGLEWLKRTLDTKLTGLDISPSMIQIAEKNAADYNFPQGRVTYQVNDAQQLPFEDNTFDAVFTNASLHEWQEAETTLNEIHRVLETGGRYFISDLRRNMNPVAKLLMKMQTKNKEMRAGLLASLRASYTEQEINAILQKTKLRGFEISTNPFSLFIKGTKV